MASQAEIDAFLHDRYPALLRFLRTRTASEQDAEDAAQEAFTRVLRYCRTEQRGAWEPLLFRIAANVANDQARQAATRHRDAHIALDAPAAVAAAVDERSPERHASDDADLARVLQAIRRLPDKCRHVFMLSRFGGLSNEAIARRCGISVRMVEKQISKALAACRDRVREDAP